MSENTAQISWRLPEHELFDGRFQLRGVIRRVVTFAYEATRRLVSDSSGLSWNKTLIQTNDEVNLLITPGSCLRNALVGVCNGFLDVKSVQIDLSRSTILRTRVVPRHLSVIWPDQNRAYQVVFYAVSRDQKVECEGKKHIGLTTEYPGAGFRIEALHLPLVRLPLVRELLGSGAVSTSVSRVALLERACHRIALSIRARAQRHVILILLVDEVLILGSSVLGR